MSLRKENSGLAAYTISTQEGSHVAQQLARDDRKKENVKVDQPLWSEAIVAVLLKRFAPGEIVVVTMEEIEDAPPMEARHDFQADRIELRVGG